MRRPSRREIAAAFNAFAPSGFQIPSLDKPPADAPLLEPPTKVEDRLTAAR